MKLSILCLFLVVVVPFVYCQVSTCFGIQCPNGTYFCEKFTKTTSNLQHLEITIKCLGSDGLTLNTNGFGSERIVNITNKHVEITQTFFKATNLKRNINGRNLKVTIV